MSDITPRRLVPHHIKLDESPINVSIDPSEFPDQPAPPKIKKLDLSSQPKLAIKENTKDIQHLVTIDEVEPSHDFKKDAIEPKTTFIFPK